jgi:hypothetical protein
VLAEVGNHAAHPALCLRCADAVESGLVGQPSEPHLDKTVAA